MSIAHPNDHKKISYKLPLGGFLFLVVFIVGFITLPKPEFEYAVSGAEALELTNMEESTVNPDEAKELLSFASFPHRLVDLRNPHDYIKGHFQGAINIPSHALLEDTYRDWLEDDQYINILYASHPDEVIPYWMLLRQLGYTNNLVLLSGYQGKDQAGSFPMKEILVEQSTVDFEALKEQLSGGGKVNSAPKKSEPSLPVIPVKRAKKSAEGGC